MYNQQQYHSIYHTNPFNKIQHVKMVITVFSKIRECNNTREKSLASILIKTAKTHFLIFSFSFHSQLRYLPLELQFKKYTKLEYYPH
jgi:hypothetical protein